MWISFVFNIFSFVIISTLVDPDQLRYLKKRNIECGIVSEAKTDGLSTRIVNGKPSSDTYPWMIQIILKAVNDIVNFLFGAFMHLCYMTTQTKHWMSKPKRVSNLDFYCQFLETQNRFHS